MEIKCPHHKTPLIVEHKELSLFGKKFNSTIGKCKACPVVYINQKLFSSTNRFFCDSIEYEFLNELCSVAIPKNTTNKHTEEIIISEEKQTAAKRRLEKVDNARKRGMEEKEERVQHKQQLDAEKKHAKKDGIADAKSRILNNSYKKYRVKNIYYYTKKPTICSVDGEELLRVGRVSFEIKGIKFKIEGLCCLRCNSVYLSEKMHKKIEETISKQKDVFRYKDQINMKSIVYKAPTMLELSQEKEDVLAQKSGNPPICIIAHPTVDTEITAATLSTPKGDTQKIIIVDNERFQDSANNVYWKERGIAKSILRAISTGKPWVRFKDTSWQVINYSNTPLLDSLSRANNQISSDSAPVSIYIYKAKTPCPNHSEQVESVTAYVKSVQDFLNHPINISYCKKCQKYYINATSFNMYSKKYGMPLIKLSPTGNGSYGDYESWKEESVLHFLGYNVNSTDNLPEKERRRILAQAVEAGYMKKTKVISFLETMIKLNEGQQRKANAVIKWKNDLDFISNYKLDRQRSVYGNFKSLI